MKNDNIKEENLLSKFSRDELIQEAECLEEYGEYLHIPLMDFTAEELRAYAESLPSEVEREE